MYKWTITKQYEESTTIVSKDGFFDYETCLNDLLKHINIDSGFRKAFESPIIGIEFKVEKIEEEIIWGEELLKDSDVDE